MFEEDLNEKVSDLEERLEELSEELENQRQTQISKSPNGFEFSEIQSSERSHLVHYIEISEATSFSSCDEINDSKDAAKVFSEAAEERTKDFFIKQGDIFVLECQGKTTDDSGEEIGDKCYYIGMCTLVSSRQKEDPFDALEKQEDDSGNVVRNFMAWNSCGGSDNFGFEKPEDIDSVLCKFTPEGSSEETVGIKLLFQEENQSGEPLSQNAFIPLLPSSVTCPHNGTVDYIKGVTITKENYPENSASYRLKVEKQVSRLTFSGGILISDEVQSSESPEYITLGNMYENEKLIEICEDGVSTQIYVPYRTDSSSQSVAPDLNLTKPSAPLNLTATVV